MKAAFISISRGPIKKSLSALPRRGRFHLGLKDSAAFLWSTLEGFVQFLL